jgi:L-amino acid N-acyltransferase YncA
MSLIRPAEVRDAGAIAAIYAEGIAGRMATYRTEPLGEAEVLPWLERRGPILVAEEENGEIVGWASVDEYSDFPPYAEVGEFAIYVADRAQGRGLGRRLLDALCDAAERDGRYKLVGKVFADNETSLALCRTCGFREVGVHRRHGTLDGVWRDVVVLERLLGPARED